MEPNLFNSEPDQNAQRLRLSLTGPVQGVGFRPFLYRTATRLGLKGWVRNTSEGLQAEAEGSSIQLKLFIQKIHQRKPSGSSAEWLEEAYLTPIGYTSFKISESTRDRHTAWILPDRVSCPDCIHDLFDPRNRRYLYPFTTCSSCGPRYSIIESLPFDRENTAMKAFPMCDGCRSEYENPNDRRYHAQTISCPKCGPRLELWDQEAKLRSSRHEALLQAVLAIRKGAIVAVKGLGGFHLIVDGYNEQAISELRRRKNREKKPFALMAPHLNWIEKVCHVNPMEEKLLTSFESPIVLLRRKLKLNRSEIPLPSSIAPENPNLGVMLPYTPLHYLLLKELRGPVVATSGNRSEEPICTQEEEAISRLNEIAGLFLVHNRPILRHLDDSIVRVIADTPVILRRARGYAPNPIKLKKSLVSTVALGGHLKNTVSVSVGQNAVVSQHIGDLETPPAMKAFVHAVTDFQNIYGMVPSRVMCDLHPDYRSTRFGEKMGIGVTYVQHHYSHVLSCMAEHGLDAPLLGVAWDGNGLGSDGTLWGGEFLLIHETSFDRFSHFRPFPLPGGEKAFKEPRRSAAGLLWELFGKDQTGRGDEVLLNLFSGKELKIIKTMLSRGINAPFTSSVGRLFDAVSSLAGLPQRNSFEGQAAIALENAMDQLMTGKAYPFEIIKQPGRPYVIDWKKMILELLEDIRSRRPVKIISSKFHNALAQTVMDVAQLAGQKKVVLTGGCFQNKYLTEQTVAHLRNAGFQTYWNQTIPPNDGGIALGQILEAVRMQGNS